ncbi:MAG: hypothetical protein M1834_009507 [Cirrosporium novae-zelandiae]|nr:MAG: hypothetical protein M1834_009507 [Cirrosporium novae-zelandiae]
MASRHRPRLEVRRSNATACQRCKARKQRCDQKLPACSNCERAGVECVGYDVATGRTVPRSYLQSLEDRIAFLEIQLRQHGISDYDDPQGNETVPPWASNNPSPMSRESVSAAPFLSDGRAEQILNQASFVSLYAGSFPRYIGTGSGLPLLRLLLAEIQPSTTVEISSNGGEHQSLLDSLSQETPLQRLPTYKSAEELISIYFEHSDFFSPILHRLEFMEKINIVYADSERSGPLSKLGREYFTCFMVFSIAILLLGKSDSSVPADNAERFFATACRIMMDDPSCLFTGDLDHLEVLLLLTQYKNLHPNARGVWHVVGLAVRLAIDLGIHEDPPNSDEISPFILDKRRRLFWATYSLDRNICSVLGRPFGIPDEAITAHFPLDIDDRNITPEGILPQEGTSRKSSAVHNMRYRQLESEIYQILHQRKPSAYQSIDYAAWRSNMDIRLHQWYDSRPTDIPPTVLAPSDSLDLAFQNCMVQLYSPSRFLPCLSDDDFLILAKSACQSIESYRRNFLGGKLRFYWRTTHNLFRSGVTLIFCIYSNVKVRTCLEMKELKSSINTCSVVLWGMAEKYPGGKSCRDVFDSMASAVMEHIETSTFASETPGRSESGILPSVQQQYFNLGLSPNGDPRPPMNLESLFSNNLPLSMWDPVNDTFASSLMPDPEYR